MGQKKALRLEPTDAYPVAYDLTDEEPDTFLDELVVTANTADALEALGATLPEMDEDQLEREKKLVEEAVTRQEKGLLKSLPTAIGAASFIKSYGQSLAYDVTQIRTALTNKLLEIADCGDIKFELKAIELLGKHSDISLFTERSEININYNSPEALENAILERVNRLIHAKPLDIAPLGADLDEELGVFGAEPIDAYFEELDAARTAAADEEEGEEE